MTIYEYSRVCRRPGWSTAGGSEAEATTPVIPDGRSPLRLHSIYVLQRFQCLEVEREDNQNCSVLCCVYDSVHNSMRTNVSSCEIFVMLVFV